MRFLIARVTKLDMLETSLWTLQRIDMEEDICNWIPEQISIVNVNGIEIPVDEVEVLNIEEDYQGRDVLTFMYKGEKRTSMVTTKYI